MSRPFPLFVAVVAVLFVAVGCKPKPAMPTVGSAAPKMVETGPPVSEKEAEEYGRKVAAAFNAKDAEALAELIGMEDLCLRSVSDFNLTASERKSVVDGFRKSGGGARVCRGWVNQMTGLNVTLLRTRVKDGRQAVLLRFLGEEAGVNYFEFTLARGADGRAMAEDIYMYVAGESVTQMLRRVIITVMPAKMGGGGQGSVFLTHKAELQRMQMCVQSGELAEARRIYFALPVSLRDEKFIQLMGMQTLQDDEKAYIAEMERYRKLHPKDPSLDLVSVDYYVLKKDAKALRECLWRLDEAVGGDPSLRVLDANFTLTQGDRAEARRLASEAVKLEDTLASGYWALIDVALTESDHAETARLLKTVVEKCNFPLAPEGLKDTELYAKFAKSKEYKELCEWAAKRAK